jgi:hypothetical protein
MQNGVVRKMPCTRQDVGHGVDDAGQVQNSQEITMEALMESLQTEEVRRRAGGGDGLSTLPGNSWSVVTTRVDSAFAHICMGDGTFMMKDGSSQFQIGIGDGAASILVGDQLLG